MISVDASEHERMACSVRDVLSLAGRKSPTTLQLPSQLASPRQRDRRQCLPCLTGEWRRVRCNI